MGVRDFENVILLPILRDLWRTVASPVLAHLSIDSASAAKPPRIWWCPTGPLAFLPIHAAGPYEDGRPGVPDLVVSSYISTLQSVLRAHSAPPALLSMLAVGLPETPNFSPLPAVQKELATIQRACERLAHTPTRLVGPAATPLAVSRALAQHSWLHLWCHAYQDAVYAFDSAFCMHGGSLTLGALMQLDLARVQFAFLSACLTSAGEARLPDECIHLAAGMQFAGVRSAVATLWAVDDRSAAFVTERVYGQLMRDGVEDPDPREAAEALHAAVGALKNAGRPMVFWVPFIHVGL
ncbi:CHAT domain-containing protein [Daedaleopsis nitida]|nr:CHAT domain-containing protein [Daedaleopsis nitida]